MAKVFRNYEEVNEKLLLGFTVANTLIGFVEGGGMMLGLERTVDNVTLGIDIIFNPTRDEHAIPFMISDEYVKRVD